MLRYIWYRIGYVIPTIIGVSLLCFTLGHIAPGDPLLSVLPGDASEQLKQELMTVYGFDRPYYQQFYLWFLRALQGDLGTSIASGRPVVEELFTALENTFMLASVAAVLGIFLGLLFGFIAGYFYQSPVDKVASTISIAGVSVPHYWLGMVLVIIFSVQLNWLPANGAGPQGSAAWRWDWVHIQYLLLPAITMSVIPMGIVARTIRALVAEILAREYIDALRAKGVPEFVVFRHLVKNAAPTALTIGGLQLGYLLGGSILIETVFSWPGTGMLLNMAIFQRDLPVLQGTILILALIFVMVNLVVDVLQSMIDPRIRRS